MRTSTACISCFQRQIRQADGQLSLPAERKTTIISKAEALLSELDLSKSPPENAVAIYALIAKFAQNPDPFAVLKRSSTEQALWLKPKAAALIKQAGDPLDTALRLAIAGNIMDYGALMDFDIDQALTACLNQPLTIDDLLSFRTDLKQAKNILYLGDNCGELVFDGLLIETIKKDVTLAVKEHPIINDATLADAKASGLPRNCRMITNGTGCPGTPLASCSPKFRKFFSQADLVISKGQGNFETLSETKAPIYYLLTVKCDTVAQHIKQLTGAATKKLALGDLILLKSLKNRQECKE